MARGIKSRSVMTKLLEARLVEEVGGLAANGSCDGLVVGGLRLNFRHQ